MTCPSVTLRLIATISGELIPKFAMFGWTLALKLSKESTHSLEFVAVPWANDAEIEPLLKHLHEYKHTDGKILDNYHSLVRNVKILTLRHSSGIPCEFSFVLP